MPKTKRTRTPNAEPPRIMVRDPHFSIRRAARIIGKREGLSGGITGAIAYAVAYTEADTRREKAPLNLDDCTIAQLDTLIVHGYDYLTRNAALAEYRRRVNGAQKEARS